MDAVKKANFAVLNSIQITNAATQQDVPPKALKVLTVEEQVKASLFCYEEQNEQNQTT